MSSRKRAFHPRKKTGCLTCRIRRVRCDEEKPNCNRCVSTGRTCDGYISQDKSSGIRASSQSSERTISIDNQHLAVVPQSLAMLLPKKNDQELRSYRFFLDVSASNLSGVFDDNFWRIDIPQICHSDAAIWHAVVSLGAAHESFVTRQTASIAGRDSATGFTVYQYNEAVRHLLCIPASRDLTQEKWRAVIASVLFTYLCSIQGLHSQATIHLTAAKGLLGELQQVPPGQSPEANTTATPNYLRVGSVPYDIILSIIANLEIQSQALHSPNFGKIPQLFSDLQPYIAWRYYTASTQKNVSLCPHGRSFPSRATPEALTSAGRASQSLLDALVRLSQEDAPNYDRLIKNTDDKAVKESIDKHKSPYIRTFFQLESAISTFILDAEGNCSCFPKAVAPGGSYSVSLEAEYSVFEQSRTAVDALRVFHIACASLLFGNASGTESSVFESNGSDTSIATSISTMLDIADKGLRSQVVSKGIRNSLCFIPKISVTQPLFAAAVNGPTLALRRRAIELLHTYRRRDGLWDTGLVSSVAKVFLDREIALAEDVGGREENQVMRNCSQVRDTKQIWGLDKTLNGTGLIPPDCQVRWAVLTFTGSYSAKVEMKTLAEWIANRPGWETSLTW